MRARNAIVLLAVISAATGWLLLRGSRRGGRPTPPAAEVAIQEKERDETAALARSVQELRREVMGLRQQVQLGQRCACSTSGTREAWPTPATPAPAPMRSDAEVHLVAARAIDQHLQGEPRDPVWSQTTEQQLAQLIRAEGSEQSGLRLHHMECQSTLCRIELSNESHEARDQLLERVFSSGPINGSVFVHHLDEDPRSPRTVVYLSRPGHSLPATFD